MGRNRHILFLNEFYHPDICASAVVAADHLPKIARLRPDWRITVVAGNRAWDDPTQTYPPDEEHEGIRIVRVPRPALKRRSILFRGLGFLALQRQMVRAAKRLGPVDLVIGTTAPPQGGCLAAKIAKTRSRPFIYKALDLYPDLVATLGRLNADSLLYRRWLKRDMEAMRAASAVVVISTPMAERIARTRGIDAAKLHTIHDGYDASRLAFDGPNQFQATHNPEGKFVVQYAGNMGLSHPFDAILAAAGALERSHPNILFQFIGDGPGRGALGDTLPANVRLIPFQPAAMLGLVLQSADLCLISQHEAMFDQAMPYKVFAILASGKPCVFVGSDKSEIAGWLGQHQAGRCVRQGDSAGLASAIKESAGDLEAVARMGRAARRIFDERFDSNRAAMRWVELIEVVMTQ